jgi:competence CoiA-like predicted nuclease
MKDKLSDGEDVSSEAEEYMKKKNILKKYFKSERDAVSIESVLTSLKISFKANHIVNGSEVRIERIQLLYVFDFSSCKLF